MSEKCNHIHCVVRADVTNFPGRYARPHLQLWLQRLVDNLGMQTMAGPLSFYNLRPGLRGWSGVILIETSHIVVHSWDEDPDITHLELDVYTCGDFSLHTVRASLVEVGLISWSWQTFDRSTDALTVIDKGQEGLR